MLSKDVDPSGIWSKLTKTKMKWTSDQRVKTKLFQIWKTKGNFASEKIVNHKRKWEQTKGEIFQILKTGSSNNRRSASRNNKKAKQESMVYHCLRGHPAIDKGELRKLGSKWHKCPINVLLASLFGKSTADQELPFVGIWKITWLFRL